MGKLIVIDGLDGSGKSTQLRLLHGRLEAADVPHVQISFPDYDSPSSGPVKMYLAGEMGGRPGDVNAYAASSFYAVDRYASYKTVWESDYAAGKLIVAARYTTSNAIHQLPKLPDPAWDGYLAWLEGYEYGLLGLPRPDAVIFLDMPPDIAKGLVSARYGGDETKKDIHEKDFEYLLSCRKAALYTAEKFHWTVVPCGEGDRPFPEEGIADQIMKIIQKDMI